ncbi:monovalent cation/H(+) antiporter subunit G [Desulfofustis limnaeus]|jgi:multicomponent Na+:H+ antiporter subunit G|uniref:Cation:proton antiporter n=1 Tax=Desulfofustis limnaeus TaxID=2740163 RepID=A0ABN6M0V4_9BACT|nr:monovalent cation/H(+) antiporter subunit G [Desulfofustis limnaeus]MDX9894814.1 monovalent cation/H(+) antiporter subunit G [Desulfofustis sp.]BDD86498.1 cation:proton antiporter [Desulfofustis limnaeus]
MTELATSILLLFGAFFCLMAAVGVARLPDALTRMHAATKAGTLGVGLLVVAEAVVFQELGIALRAASIILLLLFTTPVAAHLIGRASYLSGVKLSSHTWIDELGESLQSRHHTATHQDSQEGPAEVDKS